MLLLRARHDTENVDSVKLVRAVTDLIIPFIRAADEAAVSKGSVPPASSLTNGKTSSPPRTVLVEQYKPAELLQRLALSLPEKEGRGREGLLQSIQDILRYSVNTWDQGFMDKLYASTNAVRPSFATRNTASNAGIEFLYTELIRWQVGVVSELLLAVLNTNVRPLCIKFISDGEPPIC